MHPEFNFTIVYRERACKRIGSLSVTHGSNEAVGFFSANSVLMVVLKTGRIESVAHLTVGGFKLRAALKNVPLDSFDKISESALFKKGTYTVEWNEEYTGTQEYPFYACSAWVPEYKQPMSIRFTMRRLRDQKFCVLHQTELFDKVPLYREIVNQLLASDKTFGELRNYVYQNSLLAFYSGTIPVTQSLIKIRSLISSLKKEGCA